MFSFPFLGSPLDVTSPDIELLGILDDSDEYSSAVKVFWSPNIGSYDLSHYTVQLLQNDTLISETAINGFEVILFVPVGMNIRAKITTTSKCGETSKGVYTEILAGSGGDLNRS